jgi:hypothetical protein
MELLDYQMHVDREEIDKIYRKNLSKRVDELRLPPTPPVSPWRKEKSVREVFAALAVHWVVGRTGDSVVGSTSIRTLKA